MRKIITVFLLLTCCFSVFASKQASVFAGFSFEKFSKNGGEESILSSYGSGIKGSFETQPFGEKLSLGLDIEKMRHAIPGSTSAFIDASILAKAGCRMALGAKAFVTPSAMMGIDLQYHERKASPVLSFGGALAFQCDIYEGVFLSFQLQTLFSSIRTTGDRFSVARPAFFAGMGWTI